MSVNKKIKAAEEAIKYIENNMKIGLGTGSTADEFTKLLSIRVKEGLDVVCVPTSESTKKLANELGIILGSLNEIKNLDLTVDGADEIDDDLSLIKGGGGALLREKIIAYNSNKMIVIADDSKKVKKLGSFKLPVEVVCFEHEIFRDVCTATDTRTCNLVVQRPTACQIPSKHSSGLFPSGTGLQFWSPEGHHLWCPGGSGLQLRPRQTH